MEKELRDIFAKNLIALRTESKMTQLELGNAISYSDKAISKWERGEAIPDAYVLMKLSKIFGVTVDYLLHDHNGRARTKRTNYASVSALTVIGIFTAFAIAYISVYLATGLNYWLFFLYALIISLITLTIFNSLWGKRALTVYIVCVLAAVTVLTVYCILLPVGNFWPILCLIVPIDLIIICGFQIRKRPITFLKFTKKNTTKE